MKKTILVVLVVIVILYLMSLCTFIEKLSNTSTTNFISFYNSIQLLLINDNIQKYYNKVLPQKKLKDNINKLAKGSSDFVQTFVNNALTTISAKYRKNFNITIEFNKLINTAIKESGNETNKNIFLKYKLKPLEFVLNNDKTYNVLDINVLSSLSTKEGVQLLQLQDKIKLIDNNNKLSSNSIDFYKITKTGLLPFVNKIFNTLVNNYLIQNNMEPYYTNVSSDNVTTSTVSYNFTINDLNKEIIKQITDIINLLPSKLKNNIQKNYKKL